MKKIIILAIVAFSLFSCSKDEKNVEIHINKIGLSETEKSIKIGDSFTIMADVLPANTTDDKTITWNSSNEGVASVSNGLVTAVSIGEATITATAGSVNAKCKVTVSPIEVSKITFNFTEKEIKVDETFTLTAKIEPDNATVKNVLWESSDENIATVEDGVVKGISVGEVVIAATSTNNIKATCNVKVVPVLVAGVSFTKSSISVVEGRTENIAFTITPQNATNKNVTLNSLDENIFTINQEGLITGVNEGVSCVTVTTNDGGFVAICDVTVTSFTNELVIGMQFGNYANPGGYITMSGNIKLSNYSYKSVLINQFRILDDYGNVVFGTGVGSTLDPNQSYSIPVSFSNVYKARALFTITANGKEYTLQKSL